MRRSQPGSNVRNTDLRLCANYGHDAVEWSTNSRSSRDQGENRFGERALALRCTRADVHLRAGKRLELLDNRKADRRTADEFFGLDLSPADRQALIAFLKTL